MLMKLEISAGLMDLLARKQRLYLLHSTIGDLGFLWSHGVPVVLNRDFLGGWAMCKICAILNFE